MSNKLKKIKIWIRITDGEDGSSYANLYPTELAAREGLDEDGFEIYEDGRKKEIPCEIDYAFIELAQYKCEQCKCDGCKPDAIIYPPSSEKELNGQAYPDNPEKLPYNNDGVLIDSFHEAVRFNTARYDEQEK